MATKKQYLEPTTAAHRALADASRVRILRALRVADHPMDAREVAEEVGLHHNTVRAHLDVLVDVELVEKNPEERDTPGRPRMVYQAVPEEIPIGRRGEYRLLAEILASYLRSIVPNPAAAAEEAGRAWGGYLTERPPPFQKVTAPEAIGRIAKMFIDLGFEPEIREENDRKMILLHRCPFRDVAHSNPEVVCSVHLGLLRGLLEQVGAPVWVTDVQPFVKPSLCLVHLGERKPGA